jgi:ankyrin repeat protein
MTWTRLHDACQHQDRQVVLKLSAEFAEEAMMMDDHGSTPLHIAAWSNPPSDVIQALVAAYCQAVTWTDILGNTPVHIAASHPDTSPTVMKALLDASSLAPMIANKEGLTPLHMACRHAPSNERVIGLLIEANPGALLRRTKVRYDRYTMYTQADTLKTEPSMCLTFFFPSSSFPFCQMGEMVPRKRNWDPLSEVKTHENNHYHFVTDTAGKSNLNSPNLWFDSLAQSQDRDGSYPLHMAVANGAPPVVVEMLIRAASEDSLLLTNKHGEKPLHLALIHQADDEAIGVLLGTSANQTMALTHAREKRHGNLPIHTAATAGCSVVVAKKLLQGHPNSIHEKNQQLQTPLELALVSGRCSDDVVRLLELSDDAEDVPK